MNRRTRLALAALAALATLPGGHAAEDLRSTSRGAERVGIQLRAQATEIDPKTGRYGAVATVGVGADTVSIGDTGFVYVGAGSFTADGVSTGSLCIADTGGSLAPDRTRAELVERDADVWWAEVTPRPSAFGTVLLDVTWKHTHAPKRGDPREVAGDRRTIVLREGESHNLDFVDRGVPVANQCSRNLLLTLTARVEEDPTLEHELLHYDLWHRHTDASGRVTTRRFQATAGQGEKLDFRFAPMRFPVPGAQLSDGSRLEAILEVHGGVLGRVRGDGSIDVRVGATRWASGAAEGQPRRGGIGTPAGRAVTVEPGETVGLLFPEHQGSYGVERNGPRIDIREFYAGHEDELILTVTRPD